MKHIKRTITFLLMLLFVLACAYKCSAQGTPAQKINAFYEFTATKHDSTNIIPIVPPASRYDSTGSMYLNTTDKKIHWHYAHGKDTTFNIPSSVYPFLSTTSGTPDTLVKIYVCIPRPTGTGVNGTAITWQPIRDGGHFCSPEFDSVFMYDAGTGTLSMGFPTGSAVATMSFGGDEQSGLVNWYMRMNDDAAQVNATVNHSGIGFTAQFNGTGGWGTVIQNLGSGYVLTKDTTDRNALFFTLTDAAGYALNGTASSISCDYVGAHNYHMHRSFNGLSQEFKFILWNDSTHQEATGTPDTSDLVQVFYGTNYPVNVALDQYLTANNPYLFAGLPNEWMLCVVREYPNSLKISPPLSSAGIPGMNLSVISSTEIDLNWLPPASANDSIYELRRSVFGSNMKNFTVVFRGSATSFADHTVVTGTHYWYALTAIRTRNGSEDVHSNFVFNNGTTP